MVLGNPMEVECLMPDSTIAAPVAADPVDRLSLAVLDARISVVPAYPGSCDGSFCVVTCIAEE